MYKRKRSLKSKLGIVSGLLVVMGAGVAVAYTIYNSLKVPTSSSSSTTVAQQQEPAPEVKKPKTTRFIAAGDFIGHDALHKAAKTSNGYAYMPFMQQMQPVLRTAGVVFCNQATLVGGTQFPITGYPLFNAPAEFAQDMNKIGCNVINTASNHSFDKDQTVIDANVTLWSSMQNVFAVAGQNSSEAQKKRITTFERDGLRYAFLAYTTYSNIPPANSYGVSMYSKELVSEQIAAAKAAGATFIIVSMRWGTEYAQTVNDFQQKEAQYLADQGVSLVLGHGPHVLQPAQRIKGVSGNETVVWYSLGNFLHAQLEAETLFNGVAVMEIDPETGVVASAGFCQHLCTMTGRLPKQQNKTCLHAKTLLYCH